MGTQSHLQDPKQLKPMHELDTCKLVASVIPWKASGWRTNITNMKALTQRLPTQAIAGCDPWPSCSSHTESIAAAPPWSISASSTAAIALSSSLKKSLMATITSGGSCSLNLSVNAFRVEAVTSSPSLVMPRLRQTRRSATFATGAAGVRLEGRLIRCREIPPSLEILMPAKVFRRAAGGLGLGDAMGASEGCTDVSGRSAGCFEQKSVAGSSRQGTTSSAKPAGRSCPASTRRARVGEGVRCRLPLHWRGGVGEASKPGGRIGDMSRRGRCIMVGEQSSMSAGLRFWEAAAAA